MKISLSGKWMLAIVFLSMNCAAPALAQKNTLFSLPVTSATYAINGQVDWAGANLADWSGPIVVLINPGEPINRDGWQLKDLDSAFNERSVLEELSQVFVQEGMAVVRFDNPGVATPQEMCRQVVSTQAFDEEKMQQYCVNTDIYASLAGPKLVASIERVLNHVQNLAPKSKQLALLGIREGIVHAAAIAERQNIKISALIALGASGESPKATMRWRIVERPIGILPLFDANHDQVVTNDEIEKGYQAGIGNFIAIDDWLSSDGKWTPQTHPEFERYFEEWYAGALERFIQSEDEDGIGGNRAVHGVFIPSIAARINKQYFLDALSPLDVMQEKAIPALFFWGEKGDEINLVRQQELISAKTNAGAFIWSEIFPRRYALLSARSNNDWPEKPFMRRLAVGSRDFLAQSLRRSDAKK